MARMSDLPEALVEEIFYKVPLTSLSAVRSTCKTWNMLTRNRIYGKTGKQFLGFMVMDSRLYSMKFDLQGLYYDENFVDLSIKRVSMFNQMEILNVFYCDGLLLCVLNDNRWRVVWNPYSGETRWIQPIHKFHKFQRSDMFALGYDDGNKRNHKILRFLDVFECSSLPVFFEIYDFNSNSWKVLDVDPECDIQGGVSLKGNSYFFAHEKIKDNWSGPDVEVFLLCFDFTLEGFRPRIPLPFYSYLPCLERVTLSCIRDEHLAILYQRYDSVMEIWITIETELNTVFWRKYLKVELANFPDRFYAGSFFIDEEKKVAVVFDFRGFKWTDNCCYQTAYIIGEGGYLKSVEFGRTPNKCGHYNPVLFSFYVPSLVQLEINQGSKRKERDY